MEKNTIQFDLSHFGLETENPEAAALHLQRHFGFILKNQEKGIERFILSHATGDYMIELNRGSQGGHLGFKFVNLEEALNYLLASVPSEIILDHENVVKRARALRPKKSSNKQKPAGLIRFKIISGLNLEFHWGKTIEAHDS